MPVKKYKTFEDAEKDIIVFEPDERYFKKISEMSKFAFSILNKRKIPKGVFKYKTFEDAEKDKIKWMIDST